MRGAITIYRCAVCKRLLNDRHIANKGECACGSNRVTGASPISLIDYLKCWWWALTLE